MVDEETLNNDNQTMIDHETVDQVAHEVTQSQIPDSKPLIATLGENIMAEVDTAVLSSEHNGLARQIGAEACLINKNIGDTGQRLEKAVGDNRYTIATEAAALSKQIGAEACGIRAGQGDIRREQATGFADTRYNIATSAGDIRREIATEHCKTNDIVRQEGQESVMATKDARHDVIGKVDQTGDRLSDKLGATTDTIKDRLFAVGRDTMDLRAQVTGLGIQVRDNAQLSALQTEKAVLQNTIEGQKNTQYLADKIVMDGEKTRALINDLKYHDLNRGLVERNTELVECESDRRHWRHRAEQNQFQGQWAQLQSQIQAFQSQLQETRQGMVNFGTMAGVGQSSTSNNVK